MLRIVYKPLVDRFNIPRPTLIEWQKKANNSNKDWRIEHLQYLRDQLFIEEETKKELNQKGILLKEYFLCLTFLFFKEINAPLPKKEFIAKLRKFSFVKDFGVEYQHPFTKRIWSEEKIDGATYHIASCASLISMIESLTAHQNFCFQLFNLNILDTITKKLDLSLKAKISGSTWQELHSYNKVFSLEYIQDELERIGLEVIF